MKQDETMQDGLETLERVLGPGGDTEKPSEPKDSQIHDEVSGHVGENAEKPPDSGNPDSPPTPSAKKSTPVFVYLAVMFAAAFLMLLLAYFIQERNSAAQIGNLQSAMESIHSIDELMEENRELRAELETLKDNYSRQSEQYNSVKSQLSETQYYVELKAFQTSMASNLFLLENLMREERYEEAVNILNSLVLYIDSTDQTFNVQTHEMDDANFRTEDRLQEMADQLRDLGYAIVERQRQETTGQITLGTATITADRSSYEEHDEVHGLDHDTSEAHFD